MPKECTIVVDAGPCKMKTRIHAVQQEDMMVRLDIESDCHHILKMSWRVKPINPYTEVESPINETDVYKWASEVLPHAACPVPSAMIRAVEVSSDMGIRRDASIKYERV